MLKEQMVQFGSREINFLLEYTERKTLGITVTPDMEVIVKAPIDASIYQIKEKVYQKAPWIIKQQSYFLSFHPKIPPRRFISGETHLYLGRQYRLKIYNVEDKTRESVLLKRGVLEVYITERDRVKETLNSWYVERAKIKITPWAYELFESFARRHQISKHNFQLIFRNMPTRWGSCTPQGKIILNPELIKAPRGCIEYVIIHELCHLIHHNHSKKFFELQSREIPDWEKWKNILENLLA